MARIGLVGAVLLVWLAMGADRAGARSREIVLAPTAPVPIGRDLFGVNYVWHLVPRTAFPAFVATVRGLGVPIVRYPGGWAAERYDWDRNEAIGRPPPDGPGVDPETLLGAFDKVSFVTPSLPAIRDPGRIGEVTETTATLVRRYGGRVHVWEIGNEWWLQRGARNDPAMRSRNLAAYAALVARVAPAIKRASPDALVFATGEWTHPEDFATLRAAVGDAAWSTVDGLSIHPYCGTLDPETLCSLLPSRAAAIREAGGKTRLYASEWSLGTRVTDDDWGIRNANQMVAAFAFLITARLDAASYWPPMRGSASIALMTPDGRATATGLLFGWMARAMRGEMLTVSDGAAAARDDGQVSLIVPSLQSGPLEIIMRLSPMRVSHVASAEVMVASDPDDLVGARQADIIPLPARVVDGTVRFRLNPGGAGRSSGWEIARIVLR